MVREAIEQGPGRAFIFGEDLGPLGEGQIGRHDQAGLFVALAEEAEQVLGAGTIQRDVSGASRRARYPNASSKSINPPPSSEVCSLTV